MLDFVIQVKHVLDTWDWINSVLLQNLYFKTNYNGQGVLKYQEKFISDGYLMRFGPPVLRQIRVNKGKERISLLVRKSSKIISQHILMTMLRN